MDSQNPCRVDRVQLPGGLNYSWVFPWRSWGKAATTGPSFATIYNRAISTSIIYRIVVPLHGWQRLPFKTTSIQLCCWFSTICVFACNLSTLVGWKALHQDPPGKRELPWQPSLQMLKLLAPCRFGSEQAVCCCFEGYHFYQMDHLEWLRESQPIFPAHLSLP